MSERTDESAGISPRRRLLGEVLEARSRVVATLDIERGDPPASSPRWPWGIAALTVRQTRGLADRRQLAIDVAVVALAWLEQIDAELARRRATGRAASREA